LNLHPLCSFRITYERDTPIIGNKTINTKILFIFLYFFLFVTPRQRYVTRVTHVTCTVAMEGAQLDNNSLELETLYLR